MAFSAETKMFILPEKYFEVLVRRDASRHKLIKLKARDMRHAEKKALENAPGLDFDVGTESDPDYTVEFCREIPRKVTRILRKTRSDLPLIKG